MKYCWLFQVLFFIVQTYCLEYITLQRLYIVPVIGDSLLNINYYYSITFTMSQVSRRVQQEKRISHNSRAEVVEMGLCIIHEAALEPTCTYLLLSAIPAKQLLVFI